MKDLIDEFFEVYLRSHTSGRSIFSDRVPKEMMASDVDEDGWFEWKPIPGNLSTNKYEEIEKRFKIRFSPYFIAFHKRYFFLNGDCGLIRLPESIPTQPLLEIIEALDYDLATDLIKMKLYPFGSEGNDTGPLVFDGRYPVENNEFPIRVYDQAYNGDIEGLSEIIFSSFSKLLECITYYLNEVASRPADGVIKDFFTIDPEGAGKSGVDYWLAWAAMIKENE